MPNRLLRDWTESDKINEISVHAERFFTRLIMKADDFGRYSANPRLLKPQLFPLLIDQVREADITRWMAECQKAGLIVLYEVASKPYVQIENFNQRLRQKTEKYPPPDDGQMTVMCQTDDGLKRSRSRREEETIPAFAGDSESDLSHKSQYANAGKDKKSICDFIKAYKPTIIEPYVDLWNLFATEKSLSHISKISDSRRRKFAVRSREQAFNFIEVIRKAGQSEFLLTGKWFGFDWIIENDSNYLKVIEGNYDKKLDDQHVETAKRIIV